jgi:hypothetical protein
MTYRAVGMQGLGAAAADPAQLTPAQIGLLMNAFVSGGGCTPGMQETLKATSCLPPQYVQLLGSCYLGITPPGMNPLSFAAACGEFGKCGAFAKLGCSADEVAYLEKMPKCVDADGLTLSNYCRSHPNFQGPNKDGNLACWAMSRYPTVYRDFLSLQLCGTQATTTVQQAVAPPPAPPAVTLPQVAVLYSAPCLEPDSLMMLSYCDKYPASNGPDAYLNKLCANARSRTYQGTSYYAWGKTRPACVHAEPPPPPPPPTKVNQPPPVNTGAPITHDYVPPSAGGGAPEATSQPIDRTTMAPDGGAAAPPPVTTTHAGVSGKWVMFGLLGAVAVGGVLLWRSQK